MRQFKRAHKMVRECRSKREVKVFEPKLVAMVSVYKSSAWLLNRIENLLQTKIYQNGGLLIYLTNASSPDPEDANICQAYANHPGIKYDVIPYCTVYAAWNHIIRSTSTEFITNANSDDLVAPEAYDILIDCCNKYKSDLSHATWYTIGNEITKWSEIAGNSEQVSYYNPDVGQMSCGHGPLWRRTLHNQVGLFDPSFKALGDADFWYRCWVNGIRNFTPIDLGLMGYRWRDGDNLWNKTAEEDRSREWQVLGSRKPEKLQF